MNTSTVSAPGVAPQAPQARQPLRGFALASILTGLMLALFLEALDQTVVGTALPKIIGTLQGFDRYTWTITAYTLASATAIPIVGKLSDQFGRKWFLVTGVALFLFGSLLSGAAQTMTQFIAFRAVQGLGAGIGIALAFVVIADMFTPAERAKWQGLFGVVYGLSSLVGPFLGGWLTDHGPLLGSLVTDDTRWRWVFYINLPVGILALLALIIYLPANIFVPSNVHKGWAAIRRIDFLGALLSAGGTVCLLLGLTWGGNQTYTWDSPQVLSMLGGAAVLFALFFLAERFAVEPMLPLGLFRNQVYSVAAILSLLQIMVLVGLVVYLPLYLQGVLGTTATDAGAVTTPLTVSSVVGAMVAGFAVTKFKRYQALSIAASLLMCIGVFLLTRMTPTTGLLEAAIYMVVAGLGLGVFFSVLTVASQNALPRERLGIGTSAVRYIGQVGGALGLAVIGTVVNNSLASELSARIPASTAQQLTPKGLAAATSPQVLVNPAYHDAVVHTAQQFAVTAATATIPAGPGHDAIAAQVSQQVALLLDQVFGAVRDGLAVALQHGFVAVLVLAALCLVASFFFKDLPFAGPTDEAKDTARDEAA